MSYLSFQAMIRTYIFSVLLLLVVASALAFPPEMRRSYQARSKAMRVGICEVDDDEHTRCYVCARLYNSLELYKDCCYRDGDNAMLDSCLKLKL